MEITTQTIKNWAQHNLYRVDQDLRFTARCIDGRYPKAENLPPLAIAGADVGQVAIVMSAAHVYGFEVEAKRVFEALKALEGGVARMHDHTDDLHTGEYCGGCGHVGLMQKYPDLYQLPPADYRATIDCFSHAVHPDVLHGKHHEKAVVILTGSTKWSLYSQDDQLSAFVVHKALIDDRNRALAEMLLKKNVIRVASSQIMLPEEAVYEYLSAIFDEHLIATCARLAAGLPQFVITCNDGGELHVKELGPVEPLTFAD